MFQSNSRIENLGGIKFYEQDILFDDYIFMEDVQVTLDVNYLTPGIGIALIEHEGSSVQEKNEAYLFRVGYKEASVVFRLGEIQKKIAHSSTNIAPPIENMQLIFKKRGKRVSIDIKSGSYTSTVLEWTINRSFDKYNIGIYSNAGNTIRSIAVASSVPDRWTVNMTNTNGGYIKFTKNGFEVQECKGFADIEQSEIALDPGTYYLKYDRVQVNSKNDIEPYVFYFDDDRIFDQEKNILTNNMFIVSEENRGRKINVKFKGKNGAINNIHLTDKQSDRYVPTRNQEQQVIKDGSYIKASLDGLSWFAWSGVVLDVPSPDSQEIYSIISDDVNSHTHTQIGLDLNKVYTYVYHVQTKTLKVFNNEIKLTEAKVAELISIAPYKSVTLSSAQGNIKVFQNINAVIGQLAIKPMEDEVINLIAEKTSKKYVPGNINSPILVVDNENVPLDLSSSYRIVQENGIDQYVFTNIEREYFEPSLRIKLANRISEEIGSVKVYGILEDSTIEFDNILRIPMRGMEWSIDMMCDQYDIIYEDKIASIDRKVGEIILNSITGYKMIIVDYLKQDSYCVNYDQRLKLYEVDISTDKLNTYLIYDHDSIEYDQDQTTTDDNKTITTITGYKMTDITPDNSKYIVVRR